MMKIEDFDKSKEVALSLSKAWEFLSGEREIYDVYLEKAEIPAFADYSVFLPLSVESRTAGVGVLIHREDATVVASHMFGLPKEDLTEDDLRDACAEVCNVFSGCVVPQVSDSPDVGIGLPLRASPQDFEEITKGSALKLTYKCEHGTKRLFVLVYGMFLKPKTS